MDTLKTLGLPAAVALIASIAVVLVLDKDKLGYSNVPGISMFPASVTTFTEGGGITATSSSNSTATLLATDIDTENMVEMTWNLAVGTLTLPASSTLSNFAPNAGDVRVIWIRNASPTAATTTTIAAGAGITLKTAASSTPLLGGDTDGDNTARLEFVRKSDTDFNVYLTKFQDSL